MARITFIDNPKIPPSKTFRPMTKVIACAANALGQPSCMAVAREAKREVTEMLRVRPHEEEDETNLTFLKWCRLRCDQEQRHLGLLHSHVAPLVQAPAPLGEAAGILVGAIDLVRTEIRKAREVAPPLPGEVEAEIAAVDLPERPGIDYGELIDSPGVGGTKA